MIPLIVEMSSPFNSLFEIRQMLAMYYDWDSYAAFNSLFEIHSAHFNHQLALSPSSPFNSLFEIPCGKDWMRGRRVRTFNSLFEILGRSGLLRQWSRLYFQFSFWDSRPKASQPWPSSSLSILFLRFPSRFTILAKLPGANFQFSFWDSGWLVERSLFMILFLSILFLRFIIPCP